LSKFIGEAGCRWQIIITVLGGRMLNPLMLIGMMFVGNIFCSYVESGDFSLEEGGIDDARQSLMALQMPTTKLEYLQILWKTARAAYYAHDKNSAEEVRIQKDILLERFTEMQGALGDGPSLTLQSIETSAESFTAYKYYKNAYNA
jgi:hypothetical protein